MGIADNMYHARAFLGLLRNELGDEDELSWHLVWHNYRIMAPEQGWPQVSEAVLLKQLLSLGCRLEDRHGRPSVLAWYPEPHSS
jgi:hypothetical protein